MKLEYCVSLQQTIALETSSDLLFCRQLLSLLIFLPFAEPLFGKIRRELDLLQVKLSSSSSCKSDR